MFLRTQCRNWPPKIYKQRTIVVNDGDLTDTTVSQSHFIIGLGVQSDKEDLVRFPLKIVDDVDVHLP